MIGHSILEVLTRAFYAQHDTKTPVVVGASAMGLNVVFSFTFSALFRQIGWMPHGGLALANSLATAIEVTVLFIIMRRRLNGLDDFHIMRGGLLSTAGTLGMAAAVFAIYLFLPGRPAWLLTLTGIGAGGLTYTLIMAALRVPELKILIGVVKRRLRKN
jgi:putative peptidoglycan lipid II flippase